MVFDLSFRLINAISGTLKSYSMIHTQDVIDLRILFTSRISDDWTVQTISTKGQWTVIMWMFIVWTFIMWTFIWFEVFSTEWATITSSISHCNRPFVKHIRNFIRYFKSLGADICSAKIPKWFSNRLRIQKAINGLGREFGLSDIFALPIEIFSDSIQFSYFVELLFV